MAEEATRLLIETEVCLALTLPLNSSNFRLIGTIRSMQCNTYIPRSALHREHNNASFSLSNEAKCDDAKWLISISF